MKFQNIPGFLVHPTDESGPVMNAPRPEHFSNPKSRFTGLRKAFGTYNPAMPGQGPISGSSVMSYFTSLGSQPRGGLTRILNNGKNKIVF